jgi:hypothetical protein
MDKMKCLLFGLAIAGVMAASIPTPAVAQGMDGSPGMHPAILQLFGKDAAFSARANVTFLDPARQKSNLTMAMAMLEGKVRVDMDMATLQGPHFPPEALEQMKKAGMDKISSVMRSDKKAMYLIYPGLKAYVDMEMPAEEAQALQDPPKYKKVRIGEETVDGQPCIKHRVTVEGNGEKKELLVWNATRLKDFPVQIEVVEDGATVTMRYSNVDFSKPDAKQFDAPVGFDKYENMQELQQVIIQRMMGELLR